ncbi:TetR/AcrR family transcriptional regulator [Dyadobacter frigoris]|uniref:TetR/AcrR family transcriptional regulator n=1 Tax=Dyadobacter frigoris TaxID=2576211 RepID=A0A4U6CZR1_9BACT|nr:TetR/AcrR family transcriptional regulator [Dyadobacter frigoris]TKT86954.1 TetR/AcrR family transcriptional regulator [Dyadobacter frigoris]GLU56540.1 TetR family transcriptional regulator [Dyadobacter frigoris]
MARTKEFDQEAILDKAVDLFWYKGYHASSMQDVVDALGLSRSSIYDTFGDKRKLYIAALERYRAQAAGGLIDMVNQSKNTMVSLEEIFKMLVHDSFTDKLPKGCFMVNSTVELAPHDEEIDKIVRENMQDIENAFFQLILKGQDSGEISKDKNPRAIARFLFNTISGLRIAAKSGVKQDIYNDIVSVALGGIK